MHLAGGEPAEAAAGDSFGIQANGTPDIGKAEQQSAITLHSRSRKEHWSHPF